MRVSSSLGILLKSSRSTRWPYLFRSTTLGWGAGLEGLEEVTRLKSPGEEEAVSEAHDCAALVPEDVLVDVRVRVAGFWFGESVASGDPFQDVGDVIVILEVLNRSGNLVTL